MVSVQKIFQNVLQNINLHQRCAWEWKEQTSAASLEHTRKMWCTSRGCNKRACISLGVPWETGGVVMFWAHCHLLWSAGTSSSKVCYLGFGHKNTCSGSHHESGALGPIWEGTAHTRVCVHTCIQEWLVWSVHFVSKLLLPAPYVPGWPLSTVQDQLCHRFCRKQLRNTKTTQSSMIIFFNVFLQEPSSIMYRICLFERGSYCPWVYNNFLKLASWRPMLICLR